MIELVDVKKSYFMKSGSVTALSGVNFVVSEGDFVAVSGSSGSGKSTLLNVLGLLDNSDEGIYRFKGENMLTLSDNQLTVLRRKHIGFIFQSFNLIPVLSMEENVDYALRLLSDSDKVRQEKVHYWLNKVGLYSKRRHKPGELSGGQRQRVSIARALVKCPDLVLADEPTASLDSKTGQEVMDLMLSLNLEKKTTFIFSSHDSLIVSMARKRFILKDGVLSSSQ